jgi:hypothetical protein
MVQQPETLSSAPRVIICVSLPFKRRLSVVIRDAQALQIDPAKAFNAVFGWPEVVSKLGRRNQTRRLHVTDSGCCRRNAARTFRQRTER